MHRFTNLSIKELKNLTDLLDDAGYYSLLLPYSSLLPDFWIKSANVLNEKHKLKYMIAIRPYSISPEYCAMMCESFHEISKNRLMLNVVAGELSDNESFEGIQIKHNFLETPELRKELMIDFLKKIKKMKVLKHYPEIVISGVSELSYLAAEEYGTMHASMYDDYMKNKNKIPNSVKKMVSISIIIKNTEEEAKNLYDKIENKRQKQHCFYGTPENVMNRILSLKNEGVTDVLLHKIEFDTDAFLIHKTIKKYNDSKKSIDMV
jgi:alkanesulfonate monooxygenase SsuD/methylene tetrahydromethanopterin reductase-like flavin-dependent oxidoreductase (luciferase family)